jgi:hypothetical protein
VPLGPEQLLALFSATPPRTGDPLFTAKQLDELEHQIDQHGGGADGDRVNDKP